MLAKYACLRRFADGSVCILTDGREKGVSIRYHFSWQSLFCRTGKSRGIGTDQLPFSDYCNIGQSRRGLRILEVGCSHHWEPIACLHVGNFYVVSSAMGTALRWNLD